MAEVKIKEGSVIIEFWDDAAPPRVWVAHFPDATWSPTSGEPLKVRRARRKPNGAPDWIEGPAVDVPAIATQAGLQEDSMRVPSGAGAYPR